MYASRDGGRSWQRSSQGIGELSKVYSLLQAVPTPQMLWAGTSEGMYVSQDSGRTWQRSSQGLPDRLSVRTLLQAVQTPQMLWAGTSEGVYVSQDSGKSWQPSSQGLGEQTGVFSLLQARQNPQVLWAGTDKGVYISRDGGKSWQPSSQGLGEQTGVLSLLQARQNPQVLWAGTDKGVYVSRNGGQGWEQKKQGLPGDLIVFSIRQATYSKNGILILPLMSPGGVFWSADNGETWQAATDREGQLFASSPMLSLIVDATNPQVLYSAIPGSGIYVGIDKATGGLGYIVYLVYLSIPVVGFALYIIARYYYTLPARLEQQRKEKYSVWAEQVRSSLYETNNVKLRKFPRPYRDFICEQFRKDYDDLNLVFKPGTAALEVSERARLDAFRKFWTEAEQAIEANMIEPFRTATDALTELFCEALAFGRVADSATLGQLYGRLINADNPAFQLTFAPSFR